MNITITPETLAGLETFRDSKKFTEEDFYPGAPTEDIRATCEARVNAFIQDVISLLSSGTGREEIFSCGRALIELFEEEDTEEREKVDDYIGEAMNIIGIKDWTDYIPGGC
jgi:hypothetical protein